MKNLKYTLIGFFGFLLVTGFNVSVAVVYYSKISYKENWQIAILLIVVIVINAALCSIIDIFRRKIMISKPLLEILNATTKITSGKFDIKFSKRKRTGSNEFYIIQDNLIDMAEALSKSEILKTDFIANISHEIKTPLAIIKTYAKALENSNLTNEEKNKYIVSIINATNKLNNLITNVLKLNKLENQSVIIQKDKFNLSEKVIEQVLLFEQIIDDKKLNLTTDIKEDIYINADSSLIEIICNNLISNAIKFTNIGGDIHISLKKNDGLYELKIKDTGCGIDQESGKHIFDKFYQADTSHAKEGNGLGLALVKKVIDVIGGTIKVESELGIGTTFIVLFGD